MYLYNLGDYRACPTWFVIEAHDKACPWVLVHAGSACPIISCPAASEKCPGQACGYLLSSATSPALRFCSHLLGDASNTLASSAGVT